MRLLPFLITLFLTTAWHARAQDLPTDFVTVGFHDVVDREEDLTYDATTTIELTRFFDWLKGSGWSPVSLDDVAAARAGAKPLPPKPILLTFDDGYASVYTRVYPLLLAYRYPALVAVVGKWMSVAPGGAVQYGDEVVPRERFVSWPQLREMTQSGLVEVGAHSFDLHKRVQANPQGGRQAAPFTWIYDPESGRYEDDAAYRARIRRDAQAIRDLIARELGRPPRALVWPFGRYTGPALEEARAAGFSFVFTLTPAPDRLVRPFEIGRLYPVASDKLSTIATELGFEPPKSQTVRVACLRLDALAAAGGGEAGNAALGGMIEEVRALGANVLVIDANAALPAPDAPLGGVYFPTALRPVAADLLNRVVWQMRTRADVNLVYLHLPLAAARAAVGDAAMGELYADMYRHTAARGFMLDASPSLASIGADALQPPSPAEWDVAARRRVVAIDSLDGDDRAAWSAWQAAVAIKPQLKLMLASPTAEPVTRWPAPIADILLLPAAAGRDATRALAERLRAAQWLQPTQSGRVALTLPAGAPGRVAVAMTDAQVEGATAFAYCPTDTRHALDPATIAALAPTFSSATYPVKP